MLLIRLPGKLICQSVNDFIFEVHVQLYLVFPLERLARAAAVSPGRIRFNSDF